MRWDHVIVGGGTAGIVLAARLSEDPSRRVLVLEAGPDDVATPEAIAGPNFLAALALPGRTWPGLVATRVPGQAARPYLRGRGVGGSAAVNAQVMSVAPPEDHDRWVGRFGCDGWGWDEMRRAYARSPLPRWRVPGAQWLATSRGLYRAAVALGYGVATDLAAPGPDGAGAAVLCRAGGRRVSVVEAYLDPARTRPNLEVRAGAQAERVLLDGRRATGVRLTSGEEVEAAEVLVCAGAIHTPALLARSGVDDRPVGENLCDHTAARAVVVLRPGQRPPSPLAQPVGSLLRYSSGLAGAGRADMQVLPLDVTGTDADGLAHAAVGVALMQAWSRGRVRLRAGDTADDPVVEFGALGDERDLVRLADGVRRLLGLLAHPALAAVAEAVVMDDHGTPPEALLDMDEHALAGWLRTRALGDYVHACGTCRMGRPDDPAAVVDPQCRVIGYEGLRVVDASVMPEAPRANPMLPTVAVAERAAALVRAGA